MNKNKLFYVLIVGFISLFMFNLDVYADPENNAHSSDFGYSSLEEAAKNMSCNDLIRNGYLNDEDGNIIFDGSSYDANCVYTRTETYKKGALWWQEKINYCIIFQLAFNEDGSYKTQHYGTNNVQIYMANDGSTAAQYGFPNPVETIGKSKTIVDFNKLCPVGIEYTTRCVDGNVDICNVYDNFIVGSNNTNMSNYYSADIELNIPALINPVKDPEDIDTCDKIVGSSGVKVFKVVKNLLFIVIPIILLVLGSLDFAQAVFASDENAIKKAQGKFIKRLIIAVVIFLIPSILGMILGIANNIWPEIDATLCGIL